MSQHSKSRQLEGFNVEDISQLKQEARSLLGEMITPVGRAGKYLIKQVHSCRRTAIRFIYFLKTFSFTNGITVKINSQ